MPRGSIHEDFLAIWSPFEALGCSYEGSAGARLTYAIDLPPLSNVFGIYHFLKTLEKTGLCEFEETHYHPTRDKSHPLRPAALPTQMPRRRAR